MDDRDSHATPHEHTAAALSTLSSILSSVSDILHGIGHLDELDRDLGRLRRLTAALQQIRDRLWLEQYERALRDLSR
jgi:hypothetical protein